jgi:glycogen(starch) synthase
MNRFLVGGIYTVLKTKAPITCLEYGPRYTLLGPLSRGAPMEVEALDWESKADGPNPSTTDLALVETLRSMRERGVRFLYGRWLVEGGPTVLLFDTSSVANRLAEWKGDLWNVAGIPTPEGDEETNGVVLLGYIVAWFMGEVGLFTLFFQN